jgi:hypothetical protein
MNIYIISYGIDYEGLMDPIAAFSTEEKAIKFIESREREGDYTTITQLKLDSECFHLLHRNISVYKEVS